MPPDYFDLSEKACSICSNIFPIEHFYYGGKKRSYCVNCNRDDHRARNEAIKEGRDPREAARAFRESRRAAALCRPLPPAPCR
ncbi:MAG: hypothetical protein K0Q43_4653 [Ramlibacter sp.]|jgi:hypothetical protein|nr:hypothetical protein [Ramlibacter sp.]